MSGDVLHYSELPDLDAELSTSARMLASATGGRAVSLVMDEVPGPAKDATVVLRSARQTLSNNPELTAGAISIFARQTNPAAILVGTTRSGRQIAARLAVQLRAPVLSDVRMLAVEGGNLVGERSAYAGKFIARITAPLPCVAVVASGAYEKAEGASDSREVVSVDVSGRVKRVEVRPKPKASVDLKSASVIVSAGRGFKRKEDLVLVEKLAAAMGGVVGCSRPLSSDMGWLGEEHHIGLTGFYVRPDLYVAVGISGQLQHVAGIKDSKIIAAINNDKQAPIFQVSDYGIVGDLYQVVPALLKLLGK